MLERDGSLAAWKLDRLGRSLRDLITILDNLKQRGVTFRPLTGAIDTHTPTGRAMWQMIGVMAEFERSLISERTRAGVTAAKGSGVKFARKPVLTSEQIDHAKELRRRKRDPKTPAKLPAFLSAAPPRFTGRSRVKRQLSSEPCYIRRL
jgi:DNA invertase Pin-like site-specific DNA recombinase